MSLEEDIDRAVQAAVWRGMLPRDFIKEVRECWAACLHDKQSGDMKEFEQMLKTPLKDGPA